MKKLPFLEQILFTVLWCVLSMYVVWKKSKKYVTHIFLIQSRAGIELHLAWQFDKDKLYFPFGDKNTIQALFYLIRKCNEDHDILFPFSPAMKVWMCFFVHCCTTLYLQFSTAWHLKRNFGWIETFDPGCQLPPAEYHQRIIKELNRDKGANSV